MNTLRFFSVNLCLKYCHVILKLALEISNIKKTSLACCAFQKCVLKHSHLEFVLCDVTQTHLFPSSLSTQHPRQASAPANEIALLSPFRCLRSSRSKPEPRFFFVGGCKQRAKCAIFSSRLLRLNLFVFSLCRWSKSPNSGGLFATSSAMKATFHRES